MSKRNTLMFIAGVILFGVFAVMSARPAHAEGTENCGSPNSYLQVVSFSNNGASIYNSSESCVFDIGLASYKKFNSNIDDQELYSSNVGQVQPGYTAHLYISEPNCASQEDLFWGSLIQSFKGGVRYGSRLLSSRQIGGSNYCSYSTKTSTPTPTYTDTPTPTPSSTPTQTDTPTYTATPTETGTPTATYTDTPTQTETKTPTDTPTYTDTPTATPTTVTPTATRPGYTPIPFSCGRLYVGWTKQSGKQPEYDNLEVLYFWLVGGDGTKYPVSPKTDGTAWWYEPLLGGQTPQIGLYHLGPWYFEVSETQGVYHCDMVRGDDKPTPTPTVPPTATPAPTHVVSTPVPATTAPTATPAPDNCAQHEGITMDEYDRFHITITLCGDPVVDAFGYHGETYEYDIKDTSGRHTVSWGFTAKKIVITGPKSGKVLFLYQWYGVEPDPKK